MHASLLNENDRTVAFVIAYTPIRTGAEILAWLTPERQSEIVRRLVEFQPEDVPTWAEGGWLENPSMVGGENFSGRRDR